MVLAEQGAMSRNRRLVALALVVSLGACTGLDDIDSSGSEVVLEGSPEAIGILRFLNGPDATFAVLDIDAALDVRAARNICAHVRGDDGALGTADDDLLDTLAELDAIKYVGPSAIEHLYAYVDSIGGIPNLSVEGVALTAAEVEAIVAIANGASEEQLDIDAALDARAAKNLVAARPLADIDAVAAVPYVGPSAIAKLRDYAPSWTEPPAPPPPPPPVECDPQITPRDDDNAALWDELLVRATTLDWPYAEMVAVQASLCLNLFDAAGRDSLVEHLVLESGLDWHYGPGVYPWAEELYRGSSAFLSLMATTRSAIEERTADGSWDPNATPEGAALWQARNQIYEGLTARAAADPNAFYEVELFIEAEECSQDAVALVDTQTKEIWIIHRFPRC